VVVPDLPGFGFSDKPAKHGTIFHAHDLWARLMTEKLGYERFGAHGGDWGSTVTERLARSHADAVVAIHLTDGPFGHLFQKPKHPSSAEKKLFKHNEEWIQKEGAYALIQSAKPQSLAVGLNDSPAGLAAWMIEKFRAWSDVSRLSETRGRSCLQGCSGRLPGTPRFCLQPTWRSVVCTEAWPSRKLNLVDLPTTRMAQLRARSQIVRGDALQPFTTSFHGVSSHISFKVTLSDMSSPPYIKSPWAGS
jgi:pimeloyl-ACP methyl ester carboxylesterase